MPLANFSKLSKKLNLNPAILLLKIEKVHLTTCRCVANSIEPNQMPHSDASDLVLQGLLRPHSLSEYLCLAFNKMLFSKVLIYFLVLHENMLWYSLEVPQWGASNEYHNPLLTRLMLMVYI